MKGKKTNKWEIFEIIGKQYALQILESLTESPKRYTDLEQACPIAQV